MSETNSVLYYPQVEETGCIRVMHQANHIQKLSSSQAIY